MRKDRHIRAYTLLLPALVILGGLLINGVGQQEAMAKPSDNLKNSKTSKGGALKFPVLERLTSCSISVSGDRGGQVHVNQGAFTQGDTWVRVKVVTGKPNKDYRVTISITDNPNAQNVPPVVSEDLRLPAGNFKNYGPYKVRGAGPGKGALLKATGFIREASKKVGEHCEFEWGSIGQIDLPIPADEPGIP